MALSVENAIIDAAGAYIRKKAMNQSWYRRNANTVTTALGFLATMLTWAASQPFAADEQVSTAILIAGFVLTIFGVQKTPNGWSVSQLEELNNAEAYFIDKTPLIPDQPDTGQNTDAGTLAAEVNNFIQRRAHGTEDGLA